MVSPRLLLDFPIPASPAMFYKPLPAVPSGSATALTGLGQHLLLPRACRSRQLCELYDLIATRPYDQPNSQHLDTLDRHGNSRATTVTACQGSTLSSRRRVDACGINSPKPSTILTVWADLLPQLVQHPALGNGFGSVLSPA